MIGRLRQRPTFIVGITQFAVECLGLVRNVCLARALGPSEMGLVAALTLILSLVDMISDFGPDRLLVQAEDGDAPRFQATCHWVLVLRGFVTGSLLVLLAQPLAVWIGRPDSSWTIAILGLAPVIRGFQHLDTRRLQRHQNFIASMTTDFTAALIATLAVLGISRWIPRGESVVWVSVLQSVTLVVMSHGLAHRSYQIELERPLMQRLLRFGWPLALNSLILFGAFQGDRLVVMLSATPAELGRYAVAFQLTMVPALLISRVAAIAWLPGLSRSQRDPAACFQRMSEYTAILSLTGQLFSLGILLIGNRLIEGLYGSDYPLPGTVMAWLGIMQGWRILRAGPSLIAMSRADTYSPLAANLLRMTGMAVAAFAGLSGYGLEVVALAGCGGEVLAIAGAILLLKRRHHLEIRPLTTTSLLFAVSVAGGWAALLPGQTLYVKLLGLMCILFALGMTIRQWILARDFPLPAALSTGA